MPFKDIDDFTAFMKCSALMGNIPDLRGILPLAIPVVLHLSDECMFVAFRKLGTPDAVSPYLLREGCLICIPEPEFPEKVRLIGEDKDPLDAQCTGFPDAVPHHFAADTFPLIFILDCQGTHFREIVPEDMERAGADDTAFVFCNNEVPYVLIEFIHGARYHLLLAGELIDEPLDFFDVADRRFTNFQCNLFLS